MTDKYYRVSRGGQRAVDVTKSGAATPAAFIDVRVTIDTIAGEPPHNVKASLLQALRAVEEYITQDGWPPA